MRFDLAIFGAGPAGCACAIRARQAGLTVILLDRQPFPRYRPGESLHPGIEPALRHLGVRLDIAGNSTRRFDGVWQKPLHAEAYLQPFSNHPDRWLGYQIPRADLDALLLDTARGLGTETCIGVHAELVGREPCWQVKIGDQVRIAEVLVDATGGQTFLRRHLGLAVRRHSRKFYLRFGYVRAPIDNLREAEFQTLPDGWLYQAQIDTKRRHWCRLRSAPLTRSYCPDNLSGFEKLGTDRSWDGTWQSCEPFAGSDYFLVGDAAYRLDPSSSHGVLKALMSGTLAAYLVESERNHRVSLHAASSLYQQSLERWMIQDIAHLKRTDWYRVLEADQGETAMASPRP